MKIFACSYYAEGCRCGCTPDDNYAFIVEAETAVAALGLCLERDLEPNEKANWSIEEFIPTGERQLMEVSWW